MSGQANTIVFTGATQRIRVICTQTLAVAAFQSLSFYAVTNLDGLGAIPTVQAVFAILNSPQAFELQLSCSLCPGSQYQVTLTNLPFADSSTFSGSLVAQVPSQANTPNPQAEPSTGDLNLLFYGRDLVLNDQGDLALLPTGDFQTVQGRPNWTGAVLRSQMSNGVPWNPSYGARPNDYVNAPTTYQLPFSARLVQVARADDRTLTAQVAITQSGGGKFAFQTTMQGRDGKDPAAVTTPLPGQSSPATVSA